MADSCYQMLERISVEFGPIIARRGFHVVSISELCCCGDGLKRQGTKSNNVWGYNQTLFVRRGGGIGGNSTSHEIHLRLRHPNHHETQLLPWEDVAGTMAHELSHCVHQNHSPAFYQLMEEILEEHATNLVENMGSWIYGKAPSVPFNRAGSSATTFPITSDGKRLGGKTSGKSRLLDSQRTAGTNSKASKNAPMSTGTTPLSPESRREVMARAAEQRRQQTEKIRRRIQDSKESCVWRTPVDDENRFQCLPVTYQPDVDILRTPVPATTATPNAARRQPEIIDLTSPEASPNGVTRNQWDCWKCTFRNDPARSCCEMCYSNRENPSGTGSTRDNTTGIVVSEIL